MSDNNEEKKRRSRGGFGGYRETSSGRYQVRYTVEGVRHIGPRLFRTKTEAERFLRDVEAQLNRNEWVDPKLQKEHLGDFVEDWIRYHPKKLSPTTSELYESLLKLHIRPQLGHLTLRAVTPAVVDRWYTERGRVTGATRQRQAYKLLRAALNTAVKQRRIRENPCVIEGAGREPEPDRPFLRKEEALSLIEAMPDYMRPYVIVTLLAALRRGEILGVQRRDVDLDAATLLVARSRVRTSEGLVEKTTKNDRVRLLALPPEAVVALRDYLELVGPLEPEEYVFRHRSSGPLKLHHHRYAWDKAREKTGLTGVRFHDLRHAGLTYYAHEGASLRELMDRGGHRKVDTVIRYQRSSWERSVQLATGLTVGLSQGEQAPQLPVVSEPDESRKTAEADPPSPAEPETA